MLKKRSRFFIALPLFYSLIFFGSASSENIRIIQTNNEDYIPLDEFIGLSLQAVKEISSEIGV